MCVRMGREGIGPRISGLKAFGDCNIPFRRQQLRRVAAQMIQMSRMPGFSESGRC